jgi:hypothetical protein
MVRLLCRGFRLGFFRTLSIAGSWLRRGLIRMHLPRCHMRTLVQRLSGPWGIVLVGRRVRRFPRRCSRWRRFCGLLLVLLLLCALCSLLLGLLRRRWLGSIRPSWGVGGLSWMLLCRVFHLWLHSTPEASNSCSFSMWVEVVSGLLPLPTWALYEALRCFTFRYD